MLKNPTANAEDARAAGSVPGLGRSLEEEMATDSNILVHNSTDRGAWWTTVYGVSKSQTPLSQNN